MTALAQVATGSQTCKACGRTKALKHFARNPRARTGVFGVCDECRGAAISRGRKAAALKRAQEAISVRVQSAVEPPREQKPDARPLLARLRSLADNAAGMASMDTRIDPLACGLDDLHAEFESLLQEVLS